MRILYRKFISAGLVAYLFAFGSYVSAQTEQNSSALTTNVESKKLVTQSSTATLEDASQSQQSSTVQSSVINLSTEAESVKKIIIETGVEYSQKIAVDEIGERESGTDFSLGLGYKLTNLLTIKAKGVVTKENSGPKNTTYSNTQVTMSIKGFKINEQLASVHSVGAALPTNKEAQKVDHLKSGITLMSGLKFEGLYGSAVYQLSIARNFHEYNFNSSGSPNIEYRISNALTLTLPITDQFSISTAGAYRSGFTYGGSQRSSFSFDMDMNYDVLKSLSVNLGTSNDGSAFKSNGVDSNISAYNANTSVFRAGVSYVY